MEFVLIIKKLEGTLNPEEKEVFDEWYGQSRSNREYFERQRKRFVRTGNLPHGDIDTVKAWGKISRRLHLAAPGYRKRRKKVSFAPYMVAAGMALLISLSVYFYKDMQTQQDMPQAVIEMGSSKAVLTLGDGTEVALRAGEEYSSATASSDGISVTYTGKNAPESSVSFNELTVPRGGEFMLQLGDGTRVWLNSDSRIRYPESFADGQPRIVDLVYGEAFFEVSPAEAHGGSAFRVTTRNQEIEVLGTQFNVSAYREDTAVTSTLIEGKVAINNGERHKQLVPGQQSVVTERDPDIVISKVDVYNAMAWKEGLFGFENKTLNEVMDVLGRWYDVQVEFKNKSLMSRRLGGMLSRKQSLQHILNALSAINEDLNFRVEGKTVIVE
ncbi:FecR family protein [Sinomicrobium oceani]|uniref:FecR family protein n=1 Tax=Sinomicrobium oceani TaxID=1150368 RepID=UPI00227C4B4F|nr:FecR domain-containing protein [Sinomicrobium oceani]